MARCPSCLGDATRLALHGHLECAPFHAQSRARPITGHTFTNGTPIGDIVCQRKLYECTVSGVFIYLPLFNTSELDKLAAWSSVCTTSWSSGKRSMTLSSSKKLDHQRLCHTTAKCPQQSHLASI